MPPPGSLPPGSPPPDTALVRHAPAGDTPLRRVARSAVRMVTGTAATRELAELAQAVQSPVTTGRRIVVMSVRGGAGRSTVTALLGTVYAARRADHVLVADADPEHGSLAWRLGLATPDGLGVLAPRLLAARGGGLGDVDPLLPRTGAGLRLLPGGTTDGGARPARDVTRALSRFFAICVTDCGRGLDAPATVEVLHEAHAAVVVAPATPDGVRSTCVGLDRVPVEALPRVTVALCTVQRGGRAALAGSTAREALARYGVPVVTLPYDRHLAAAAPIVPARIGEATVVEATRLAGHALAAACRG